MNPAHRQAAHRFRLDWGPTGAQAVAAGAEVAVVVDVLSFTTTLTVAVERGITVLPFAWRDERAPAYAAARSSLHANGSTVMPRSTATASVVVNDSTSTTTATSAPPEIASAPVGPQSNRTR